MALKPIDETSLDDLKEWTIEKRIERLEVNDGTTIVERRRITKLQASQLVAVLFMGALLAVSGFFYGKHLDSNTKAIHHADTKANEAQTLATKETASQGHATQEETQRLVEYQVGSCKRSNQGRITDNRTALTSHEFFRATATLLRASLVAQPQPGAFNEAQAAGFFGFIARLEGYAGNLEWRPLTPNCELAVKHPATYKLESAVRFSEESPPRGALHINIGPGLDE